jgi:succinyl-CoA synthetase beta subunit
VSRKKISEFRAKVLIFEALGKTYKGLSVNLKTLDKKHLRASLDASKTYVIKVDQAVKKRNTMGLVKLKLTSDQIIKEAEQFRKAGYSWALVEEFYPHSEKSEAFFALSREEKGIRLNFSSYGGVTVEDNADKIQEVLVTDGRVKLSDVSQAVYDVVQTLVDLFELLHLTYLEINPLILEHEKVTIILDAAVEVDTAAEFFVDGAWSKEDFRDAKKELHDAEVAVEALAATSPSSLSLKVLNENGSLFLLLSGGGASVVVVDEIAHLGHHDEIANYGEYSGNPTEEETYLYTKQVIKLMLGSPSKRKVLVIAGGVANFTDVAKTFKGVMRAIDDSKAELVAQHVKVFVRRGGPNQKAGLIEMKRFLDGAKIDNSVNGPEVSLSGIVREAVKGWNDDRLEDVA